MSLSSSTVVLLCALFAIVASVHSQADPGNGDNSATCPTESQFFDQVIDHTQQSSSHTFKQQYRLNTTTFKEGGPILFYQSPETVNLSCADKTVLADWAQELGGMVVTLEHRYFGLSLPFGNESYTTENLQYFTLENVMADAVTFMDIVKKNVTGAEVSKVIVVGGSYGGLLSAVFRQNYPDTFFGAWSVAGPFRGFGDADEAGPEAFNWFNYAQNIYARRSLESFTRINVSFAQVYSWLDSGNGSSLQQSLSLCSPPSNSSTDRTTLISWLTSAYVKLAQLNHLPKAFYNVTGPTLDTVINDTLSADSPIAAMNETLCHAYGLLAPNGCLNYTVSSDSSLGVETIPFTWVNCKWYPQNFALGINTIFGQGLTPTPSNPSTVCAEMFNTTQVTGAEVHSKYKITQQDIADSTRIIFSEGEYDPTTSISMPQSWLGDVVGTDLQKSVVIMINGIGHGQDVEPTDLDSPSVVAVSASYPP
ncbi:peptidase S28 [Lentinus brumalis]|uniref:Peptidase S28 n=1 Tax=Lentinus brumalis TaxID=2498619 RepID=A0A371D1P9_9APHY|nr:peptidase S28 [Polyporus brumalis]